MKLFTDLLKPAPISQRRIDAANAANQDITIDWTKTFYTEDMTQIASVTCKKCNDTDEYRPVKMLVKGIFRCFSCVVKQYSELLSTHNFSYIRHKSNLITCLCNTCGSTCTVSSGNLQKGLKPVCEHCKVAKYNTLANSKGFEYISRYQEKGTRVLLKCLKDSTISDVSVSELHNDYSIRCHECDKKRLSDILAEKQCSFVSIHQVRLPSGQVKLRVTYLNSKNEKFEATSGNILSYKFACSKEGHWNQPHSTYVILHKYNNQYYCKIGTAEIPESRLRKLKLDGESKVWTLESFDTRFDASSLEVALHLEFKDKAISPEVANLFSNAVKLCKNKDNEKYTICEGVTEWFSADVFDVLKERYKLKDN